MRKPVAPSPPTPPRASAARSKRIPVTAAAAPANVTATSRLAATEPVAARRLRWRGVDQRTSRCPRPCSTRRSQQRVLSESVRRQGVAHSGWADERAGTRDDRRKHVHELDRQRRCRSRLAVSTAAAQRTTLIAVRTRSPRNRSTSIGANGAVRIDGTIRTAPRIPTASVRTRVVHEDEQNDEKRPVGCSPRRPRQLDPPDRPIPQNIAKRCGGRERV